MKSISFVFLVFFVSNLFSQQDDTLNPDTALVATPPPTAFVRNPVMDSLRYQLASSNSAITYILPNSLLPSIHSSMSSFDRHSMNFTSLVNLISELHYNAKGAWQDSKNGTPTNLFPEGVPTFDSEKDLEFQHKYRVEFLSPGFFHMIGQNKDKKGYNRVIFAYLDKKYGTAWRSELRADAIGFEKPETTIVANNVQLNAPTTLQIRNSGNPSHALRSANIDPGTLVLWYILPTSGFVLLLSFYLIIKRRKKN